MRATHLRLAPLLSVLILGGCTQLTTQSNTQVSVPVNIQHTPLPASVSEVLSQQMGYALIQTEETHWGVQIELDVSPVYLSANGRVCREMSVAQTTSAMQYQVIACQYGHYWGVIRNVTKALVQQGL